MGFAKGHVPWNKGKSMSKQLRRKISRLVKDLWEDKDYRKRMSEAHVGKKLPKEQKQKIGEATKRLWTKEEYRNKTLKALRKALNIRPNHQEQKLIELIKENTLPYKYVGDGAVIINGFCPDFINCNGAKKIIEVFGDYWHNRPNMAYYHTEEGRKAVFREYGFDTLVIWEHELSEPDRVLQRILEFDGSITGREI